MIKTIFQSAIFLHVLAGIVSLASGLVAMSYGKKGGKVHNISGRIFYWAMFFIFITTVLFFVIYPEKLKYQFFLTIGIVSFYPNWSGKRMLSMKKGLIPKWYDKFGGFAIGISGLVMVVYGIYGFQNPTTFGGLQYLFLVFGMVSIINSYGDLKYYLNFKTAPKMHWFFAHGGKMMGAYSAAITAFCVNIVPRYLPENFPSYGYLITWIAPGVIVGVVANVILKRYKIKFKLI